MMGRVPVSRCVFVLFWAIISLVTGEELFEDGQYYPWIYDNDLFGGPDFWGLVDKHWTLCSKGKLQSPISIESSRLAFDPNLKPLQFDNVTVISKLRNLGQFPVVTIDSNDFRWPSPNASSGPLRPYRYRLDHIQFHFGRDGKMGSEHALDSNRFPMEIQFMGINTDLYANYSMASKAPHGLMGISIMVEIGPETNEELLKITMATASVIFKGQQADILDLKPWRLMPKTEEYVTYEGSTTSPGCDETVKWIVFNKPIYIMMGHFQSWNELQQTPTQEQEPRFTSPNARNLQELNQRILRTNINHKIKNDDGKCKSQKMNIAYFSKPKNASSPALNVHHHHHKRRHGHHSP